jgi:hypothetical protein
MRRTTIATHRRHRFSVRPSVRMMSILAALVLVPGAYPAGNLTAARSAAVDVVASTRHRRPFVPRPSDVHIDDRLPPPSGEPEPGAAGRLPTDDQPGDLLIGAAKDPQLLAARVGIIRALPDGPLGIPAIAFDAYRRAETWMNLMRPACHLDWPLLAAIGQIESGHARGGRVDANGETLEPIRGPVLDGQPGMAAIADTDHGLYDGDPTWDRAVGPMQFIPSTWQHYAADGNNDGIRSPHNLYDAALAAGAYLCSGGADLADPASRARAVHRYNPSDVYVSTVLVWADAYAARARVAPGSPVAEPGVVPDPSPLDAGIASLTPDQLPAPTHSLTAPTEGATGAATGVGDPSWLTTSVPEPGSSLPPDSTTSTTTGGSTTTVPPETTTTTTTTPTSAPPDPPPSTTTPDTAPPTAPGTAPPDTAPETVPTPTPTEPVPASAPPDTTSTPAPPNTTPSGTAPPAPPEPTSP